MAHEEGNFIRTPTLRVAGFLEPPWTSNKDKGPPTRNFITSASCDTENIYFATSDRKSKSRNAAAYVCCLLSANEPDDSRFSRVEVVFCGKVFILFLIDRGCFY